MRTFQANAAMRENTATALAALVQEAVPDSMVNGEMSEQLQQLAMRLQGQGMNLETWMQMTGQDPESFTEELREAAERSAKVDLALRSMSKKKPSRLTTATSMKNSNAWLNNSRLQPTRHQVPVALLL